MISGMPAALERWLVKIEAEKALSESVPAGRSSHSPALVLFRVLGEIPATAFQSNDSWFQFIASAVATFGDGAAVQAALEEWSRSDPKYATDATIGPRIRSLSPSGGVRKGTFVKMVQNAGASKELLKALIEGGE